jgi:hypothetical protein
MYNKLQQKPGQNPVKTLPQQKYPAKAVDNPKQQSQNK